ncbi:unnamed protein product [Lathyrus oleraceus]
MENSISSLMNFTYLLLVVNGTLSVIFLQTKIEDTKSRQHFHSLLMILALSFHVSFLHSITGAAIKSSNSAAIPSVIMMMVVCISSFFMIWFVSVWLAAFTALIWLLLTTFVVVLSIEKIVTQSHTLTELLKKRLEFFKKKQNPGEIGEPDANVEDVVAAASAAAAVAVNSAGAAADAVVDIAVDAAIDADVDATASSANSALEDQINARTLRLSYVFIVAYLIVNNLHR